MADFAKAEAKTGVNEGGYGDHAADAGGETYRGIASAFHPTWVGWPAVRRAVEVVRGEEQPGPLARALWPEVARRLSGDSTLRQQVADFYRAEYWDRLGLTQFPSQLLAEVLYDGAVNCGLSRPALWLQQALNALNEAGKLYPDLLEDGAVGPKTLALAVDFQRKWPDRVGILTAAVLVLRGGFHLQRMREKPDQEVFARSWLGRVARQMGELA